MVVLFAVCGCWQLQAGNLTAVPSKWLHGLIDAKKGISQPCSVLGALPWLAVFFSGV